MVGSRRLWGVGGRVRLSLTRMGWLVWGHGGYFVRKWIMLLFCLAGLFDC